MFVNCRDNILLLAPSTVCVLYEYNTIIISIIGPIECIQQKTLCANPLSMVTLDAPYCRRWLRMVWSLTLP